MAESIAEKAFSTESAVVVPQEVPSSNFPDPEGLDAEVAFMLDALTLEDFNPTRRGGF